MIKGMMSKLKKMKKIKDGTHRARNLNGGEYEYGCYVGKQGGSHMLVRDGEEGVWQTPIKIKTLRYRLNGKWVRP